MRLSDHIAATVGSPEDIGGIFTNMAAALRDAERFELTDDVARAAYNLTRSKPTSLLHAMPLCRSPYRKIWLEWRGGITSDMIKQENKRDPKIAPDPIKQGCLIETDATGQRGTMTFAWVHKERPEALFSPVNICPLGTLFNWDEDGNVYDDAVTELGRRYQTRDELLTAAGVIDLAMVRRYTRGLTDEGAKAWMERSPFHDWSRHSSKASERKALQELGRHEMPWITPLTHGFFAWCAQQAIGSEDRVTTFLRDIVRDGWEQDIEGEPPFAETIIAMMNSRNAIEHREVDLSGLNKARAKRGRPLFLPYRTTHLRLSQAQTRAFRAGLLSREEAGRHTVRGHFKIRKTGVYWWSPFFRGDPAKSIHRQEYKVQ
jgi:hypothetical protein